MRRAAHALSRALSVRRASTLVTSPLRPSRIAVDYDALAGNFAALQSAAPAGTIVVPTVRAPRAPAVLRDPQA